MIEALDTSMIQDEEEEEIKHVFVQCTMSKIKREANLKEKTLINNNMLIGVHQGQEGLITNCIKYNDHEEDEERYSIPYWIKQP